MAEAVMVRKKKTVKSSGSANSKSASSRDKTRRQNEKKSSSLDEKVDLITPIPKTLEKVSPTTPEIRIDTCESIDADSLSHDVVAAAAATSSDVNRPKELIRNDTLDEVLEVEDHDTTSSPTLPPQEREALTFLEDAIAESERIDENIRQRRDSLRDEDEEDDSLPPLTLPTRGSAMESSVSYEVLDSPLDPTTPAAIYPNLAAELLETDVDGALKMGIEEMDYRNYLLSGSQPSEASELVTMQSQDSIEADFLRQRDSRLSEDVATEEQENVFEKAFSDACDMQLQAALTASMDEAAAKKALLEGEPQPAEIDLTNVTALTESLTEATTVSTVSPSAPPMMTDVTSEMKTIAEAEVVTPGVLVLPEGSVENMERKAFMALDSLETSDTWDASAPVIDITEVSVTANDGLEATAPILESLDESTLVVGAMEASAPVVEVLDVDLVSAEEVREVVIDSKTTPLSPVELAGLCANPLLNQQTKILEDFFAEVLPAMTSQHPLHELLVEYQRSRAKLLALEEHLFQLKRDMEAQLPGLWSSSMQSTVVEGVCRDNHKVSQQLTYEKVAFNSDHLPNVARALSTVRIFAQEQLSHAAFVSAKNRLKINVYLHKLYTEECPLLQNIPAGASVTCNDAGDIEDVLLQHQIKILRSCINVLFAFQRRPHSDAVFQNDTQEWLARLVATLLRLATHEDHLYIFHHLLRCPPGVAKWGAAFLQIPGPGVVGLKSVPDAPVESKGEMRKFQIVNCLSTLLQTVDNREDFLCDMQTVLQNVSATTSSSTNAPESAPWVFLDTVGPDDVDDVTTTWHCLKETDLIAFLDQLPIDALFDGPPRPASSNTYQDSSSSLVAGRRLYPCLSAPPKIVPIKPAKFPVCFYVSETLRCFAFATSFVEILCGGMDVYKSARYRLFTQRLAVLLCKAIDWAGQRASSWACPELERRLVDPETEAAVKTETRAALGRIKIEFDAFFYRSVTALVNVQKLGAWMFIADLAFSSVSEGMARKLLRLLSADENEATAEEAPPLPEPRPAFQEGNFIFDTDSNANSPVVENVPSMDDFSAGEKLEKKLVDLPMSDVNHLLTTMAKLACARPIEEVEIIKEIVKDLYRVSFVSPSTREFCSKLGQQLLALICGTHPHMLSFILQHLMAPFSTEGGEGVAVVEKLDTATAALIETLPVSAWRPTEKDLQVLRHWLLNAESITSIESKAARDILTRIDWSRKDLDGSLMAHYLLVKNVATLVIEGFETFCGGSSETEAGGGYWISAATANVLFMGYRQVTHFTKTVLKGTPDMSPEEGMTVWAWQLLMRLDMHNTTIWAIHPPLPTADDNVGGVRRERARSITRRPPTTHSSAASGHLDVAPKLDADPDLYPVQQAVKNQQSPLASYVGILLTQIGQSPENFISENGIRMFRHIVDYRQFDAAVDILRRVLPLFFVKSPTCLEYLAENQDFADAVALLVKTDGATSASAPEASGILDRMVAIVLSQLTEAVVSANAGAEISQLTPVDPSHAYFSLPYSFGKPRPVLVFEFWCRLLTAVPNWNQEPSILFVLEKLILFGYKRISSVAPIGAAAAAATTSSAEYLIIANKVIQERFKELLGSDRAHHKGLLYSVVSWVSSSSDVLPTLMEGPMTDYGTVALHILQAETNYEEEIGVWSGLQRELLRNPRVSPDAALKTILTSLSLPASMPLSRLGIFRWANQVVATNVSHPLLPLLFQRFFAVYLQRPSGNFDGIPHRGSVGDILFSSNAHHSSLMKNLKKHAKKCADHYYEILRQHRAVNSPAKEQRPHRGREPPPLPPDPPNVELVSSLINFYKSCEVWLDEPRLHESAVYLPSLPEVYDSPRLLRLFNANDKEFWLELVDIDVIASDLDVVLRKWRPDRNGGDAGGKMTLSFRTGPGDCAVKYPSCSSQGSSFEIVASQNNVSSPGFSAMWQRNPNLSKNWSRTSLPPPDLAVVEAPFPPLAPKAMVDDRVILSTLRSDFSSLVGHCRAFAGQVNRATDLDNEYLELLSKQYINEPTSIKVHLSCKSLFNPSHRCKGANAKTVTIEEKKQNVSITRQISENRLEISEFLPYHASSLLSKSAFTAPPNYLIISAARVEHAIDAVIREHEMKKNDKSQSVGASLFYYMMKLVSPDTTERYIPMRQFFSTSLETLGHIFILPITRECQTLVTSILNLPHMAGVLSPLLPHPASSAPDTFLQMYTHVVSEMKNHPPDLIFMLMTKFDVGLWLQTIRPKLSDRAVLLATVGTALSYFGLDPPPESQLTFDILKSHLRRLVRYRFPDMYGDFLRLLLRESERSNFSPCLWPVLLEPLETDSSSSPKKSMPGQEETVESSGPTAPPSAVELDDSGDVPEAKIITFKGIPRSFRKEFMDPITPALVKESLECLNSNFMRLRSTDPDLTTFGLYPRWRPYVSSLAILYRFLGLHLMESQLGNDDMGYDEYLVALDLFWTAVGVESFRPWLHPLEGRERVMTPWIEGDAPFAIEMLGAFKDVSLELCRLHKRKIEHVYRGRPLGTPCLYAAAPIREVSPLNLAWNLYCTVLSLPGTSLHILDTFHEHLREDFAWSSYSLDMHSIELMLQLRETRHPRCFDFLARVFAEFPWVEYLMKVVKEERQDQVVRIHTCFLDLLVTLGTTKPFLDGQLPAMESLFVKALEFNWQYIDRRNFDAIVQRFQEQCEADCICAKGRLHPSILPVRLLKAASVLEVNSFVLYPSLHPETQEKRVSMVRAIVDLAVRVLTPKTNYKKNIAEDREKKRKDSKAAEEATITEPEQTVAENLIPVLSNLMTDIEGMTPFASEPHHHHQELVRLLSEVFSILNKCPGEPLPSIAEAMRQFLAASTGSVLILPSVSATSTIVSLSHMSQLLETCVETHFNNEKCGEYDMTGWKPIVAEAKIPEMAEDAFIAEALNSESYLTLYVYLLQKIVLCRNPGDEAALLNRVLGWASDLKVPLKRENEAKILLWWGKVLELLFRQISFNAPREDVYSTLVNFTSLLAGFAEDKATSGFFAMIGLGKRSPLSTRFRLVSRVVEIFLLGQIREDGSVRINPEEPLPQYLIPDEIARPASESSTASDEVFKTVDKQNPSPSVLAGVAAKHFASLNGLKTHKQYVELKPELEASLAFITDPKHVIFHVYKIYLRLVASLYADKKYLDILHLPNDTYRCLP